ncbi:MAG: class I SAM-dependent methyltransferase [Chloroflexi bacterium]|nr:class I SAM-dependent methyltransferase [Chloroflexota bacterium]
MEALIAMETKQWPLELFNKSVLKQEKYRAIVDLLGPTASLRCLDLGGDNGVISALLRARGGHWSSVDLESGTVASIRELVETEVYQIDGRTLPFPDRLFDRVVIIDLLEHVADDAALVAELARVMKPDGLLVVNVPHAKDELLRKLRNRLGQTDEQHGHLRPGYTAESLERVLRPCFEMETSRLYSGFFTELMDTMIVFGMSRLQSRRGKADPSKKGLVVTGQDMKQYRTAFKIFSVLYPFFRAAALLDSVLRIGSGYKLVARAHLRPVGQEGET